MSTTDYYVFKWEESKDKGLNKVNLEVFFSSCVSASLASPLLLFRTLRPPPSRTHLSAQFVLNFSILLLLSSSLLSQRLPSLCPARSLGSRLPRCICIREMLVSSPTTLHLPPCPACFLTVSWSERLDILSPQSFLLLCRLFCGCLVWICPVFCWLKSMLTFCLELLEPSTIRINCFSASKSVVPTFKLVCWGVCVGQPRARNIKHRQSSLQEEEQVSHSCLFLWTTKEMYILTATHVSTPSTQTEAFRG